MSDESKALDNFPESAAVCQHCRRGIYYSAIGWMHSHSGGALCASSPHLPATPARDIQCDTWKGSNKYGRRINS